MVQRLLERLLARVSISAKDVTVNLGLEDAEVEMRLPAFTLGAQEEGKRIVSFFGLGMYFRSMKDSSQGSDIIRTDSGESTSSGDDMAMSMAIADLRTSDADVGNECMSAVEESVYLSAGEDEEDVIDQEPTEAEQEESKTASEKEDLDDWQQILSFGADPLGIKLHFGSSGSLPARVEVIACHITLLLSPSQIATFLTASKHLPSTPASSSSTSTSSSNTQISASIKSFTAFFPLSHPAPTPKFWHKPTSPHLPTPHLRLRLHKLSYTPQELIISDLSLQQFDLELLKPIITLDSGLGYDLHRADEKSSTADWKKAFPLIDFKGRKVVEKGVMCSKGEKSWEVEMQPVCVVLDLDLMRRCEELLDVFGDRRGEDSEDKTEPEEAGSQTRRARLNIRCPMVRLEVSCMLPEDIMPLGVLTLDLHGINAVQSPAGQEASWACAVLLFTQPTGMSTSALSLSS